VRGWSVAAAVGVVAAALVPSGGQAAAGAFQLVFAGHHTDALLHEGPFTSSSPLCSSGQAADVAIDERTLSATRVFTCAEGGTFTAKVSPLPNEHSGTGRWEIFAGTGPLADLRGAGTFAGVLVSGSLDDPRNLVFRSTWSGVVDLDGSPPQLAVLGAKVQKLTTPPNARRLTLALSLKDANAVSYLLTVDDRRSPPNVLAARSGRTTKGTLTITVRVRPKIGTRYLRIELEADDAVGNASTVKKVVRLR
jgi:hypothetical protein